MFICCECGTRISYKLREFANQTSGILDVGKMCIFLWKFHHGPSCNMLEFLLVKDRRVVRSPSSFSCSPQHVLSVGASIVIVGCCCLKISARLGSAATSRLRVHLSSCIASMKRRILPIPSSFSNGLHVWRVMNRSKASSLRFRTVLNRYNGTW